MKVPGITFLARTILPAAVVLTACTALSKHADTTRARTTLAAPGAELVFNEDFPDPTMVRAGDGRYYAYSTQARNERAPYQLFNLPIIVSDDLEHWSRVGDALPVKPTWASTTQDFWAPHIVMKASNQFVLYFSAKPDDSDGLCLGVAQGTNPKGPFTDKGSPLVCGNSFENIDPMAFHDPVSKKDFMYWGSGFGPLKVQALTPDGLDFEKGSAPTALLYPIKPTPSNPNSETSYRKLLEASWVEYHNGAYYLFFSGDNCCGPNAHYGVMVAKSNSPTGPFVFQQPAGEAEAILESFKNFKAPGHNAMIEDKNGQTWMFFHAIDETNPTIAPTSQIPGDRTSRRVLLRARVNWNGPRPSLEL